jgi:hypothetical protein
MVSCASLPNSDPLTIDVAGINPLPGEGLELRLQIDVRLQNPNDTPVDYSGAALDFFLNSRRVASGVSDVTGSLPRYGEVVLSIPVTLSSINVARLVFGIVRDENPEEFTYRVRGKREGGWFGTRRFEDEGVIELDLPAQ